jgi:hypothetical protein
MLAPVSALQQNIIDSSLICFDKDTKLQNSIDVQDSAILPLGSGIPKLNP